MLLNELGDSPSAAVCFYSLFRDRCFSTHRRSRILPPTRVSIRCFATGASQRPPPALMGRPSWVSIRCFATGASQPVGSCTQRGRCFYSLFRDRCFSTPRRAGMLCAAFLFAVSRQVLLNLWRSSSLLAVAAFLFAVSRQVLLNSALAGLTLSPGFYSLFRDRCFSTEPIWLGFDPESFYSLFRDRCFSTRAVPALVATFGSFLFAVSRQVLLNHEAGPHPWRGGRVSIRCFATGASQPLP